MPDDACGAHAEMDGRAPREYEAWTVWANDMARTHVQKRCPDCGLWKIWEPKGQGNASDGVDLSG